MIDEWLRAAEQGNTQVILDHLERGADINAKGDYGGSHGVTALMLAVDGRRIGAIEALIRRGADLEVENDTGWTAMTWAVIHARGRVLQEYGWPTCDPDTRPLELLAAAAGRFGLREAVLLGDVDLARRLCDQDGSIDVSGDARFCFHDTYLMLAANLGSLDMVDFLIDRGADIEGTDDLGHAALMRAAGAGHASVVARLLDQGAEVNRGWPSATALSETEAHGHQGVASLLQARGAKRRLLDAVNLDDLPLAEELLRDGADPEMEDVFVHDGADHHDLEKSRIVRLAMHAVARGNVEIVRLLLNHGASLHVKYHDKHTLLAEAARQGHVDMVRLLIEHGADVHAVGEDGLTALEWAIRRGYPTVVRELTKGRKKGDIAEWH